VPTEKKLVAIPNTRGRWRWVALVLAALLLLFLAFGHNILHYCYRMGTSVQELAERRVRHEKMLQDESTLRGAARAEARKKRLEFELWFNVRGLAYREGPGEEENIYDSMNSMVAERRAAWRDLLTYWSR